MGYSNFSIPDSLEKIYCGLFQCQFTWLSLEIYCGLFQCQFTWPSWEIYCRVFQCQFTWPSREIYCGLFQCQFTWLSQEIYCGLFHCQFTWLSWEIYCGLFQCQFTWPSPSHSLEVPVGPFRRESLSSSCPSLVVSGEENKHLKRQNQTKKTQIKQNNTKNTWILYGVFTSLALDNCNA